MRVSIRFKVGVRVRVRVRARVRFRVMARARARARARVRVRVRSRVKFKDEIEGRAHALHAVPLVCGKNGSTRDGFNLIGLKIEETDSS